MIHFPDPREIRGDIVAVGDDLSSETLIDAYRRGIFPWPMEGISLPWFCPRKRGVLFFQKLHLSRSLTRARRQSLLRFTIDEAFPSVIAECAAQTRPDQDGTWIDERVLEAYCKLHRDGVTHSVEAWEGSELVGGIYGVDAAGAFAGESMFFRRPNASKLALLHLTEHLQARGLEWMDIQVMTPHMKALGAQIVRREAFLDLLASTQKRGLRLFDRSD